MSRLGRPGEKLPLDVLAGARSFHGQAVAAQPAGNYPLPHERFYYAAPFQFSRAFAAAFHSPPEGRYGRLSGAVVLPPSAAYLLLAVCASLLALSASRPGRPRSFLPD